MEKDDKSYFGYYNQLSHQQNMLQDIVRTSAYHQAILKNAPKDFQGKVVLDVGCGSGILSFFAAQAGARRVYAVEAAEGMAGMAKRLAKANGLDGVVEVIVGKIEEVELPEKVDVIISEPMGVLLLHERMLESFLLARDKWLRPSSPGSICPSQMFPCTSTIHFAPFSDAPLYASTHERAAFWESNSFFGLKLTSLAPAAIQHVFAQPVVGGIEPKTLMSSSCTFDIDFTSVPVEALHSFSVPLGWTVNATGICHGIAAWFDVSFLGSSRSSVLSTGPDCPRTHWHQVKLLFKNPLALNRGQTLTGLAEFKVNTQRSYDILVRIDTGAGLHVEQNYTLNDQQYSNLTQTEALPVDFNMDYLSIYTTTL